MRALKYFNETIYISATGSIYGERQVGEYMYQVIHYNTHKLVNSGSLFTEEMVKKCFNVNYIYEVDKLISFYESNK